jgi:hypothetical protein
MLEKLLGFKQSVHSLERVNHQMAEATKAFWEAQSAPPAEKEGEVVVLTQQFSFWQGPAKIAAFNTSRSF